MTPGSSGTATIAAVAIATFGRPSRTYVFGSYRVLVWPGAITVSSSGSTGP